MVRRNYHVHQASGVTDVTDCNIDGSFVPVSQHDRHFLHYTAVHDCILSINGAKKLAADQYPDTPVSSLCFRLTYIGCITLTVSLASTVEWGSDDERLEIEGHLLRARQSRGVLVTVIVRNNHVTGQGSYLRRFPLVLPWS